MKWSLLLLPVAVVLSWATISVFAGQFTGPTERVEFIAGFALISLATAGVLAVLMNVAYRLLRSRWMLHWRPLVWGLSIGATALFARDLVSVPTPFVDYRGTTNLSSCTDAIASSKSVGSVLVDFTSDPQTGADWYLLKGQAESKDEETVVACFKNRLMSIAYRTMLESEAELLEFHGTLHSRLAALHGATEIRVAGDRRMSAWCFEHPFEPGEARFYLRPFFVENESALLFITSARERAAPSGFRLDVGLDFASLEC